MPNVGPSTSVTFESHIKIISLCDALPFKESVITLLLAISSSMISYFCSIMANYQAIYLFLLFQMLHYGPAIPVVFQVLWRLAIPCFSPSFKGHFISGQAPSLPSGLYVCAVRRDHHHGRRSLPGLHRLSSRILRVQRLHCFHSCAHISDRQSRSKGTPLF